MNEGTWSLDGLYLDFTDERFAADFAALQQSCREVLAFAGELEQLTHAQLVHEYLTRSEQLTQLAEKLFLYANLRQSANTADADAASWCGRLSETLSSIAGAQAACQAAIAAMEDLDEIIAADPLAKEYEYLLGNIRRDSRYLLGAREEEIFSRMDISGAEAWSNLQSQLTSSLKVDYDGCTTTLSSIRNLAYDADGAVRKAAYEAELAAYPKIADSVAFSLNSIKQQVLTECAIRGYQSPLEKTLLDARMTRKTLDALLEAMVSYFPKFWSYLRRKGECLGHADGLPWYDLFAPMGSSSKRYTVEEAKQVLLELFGQFDESLRDMAARAFDERWIDFYPRPGKVGGAFCAGLPSLKQSRVLTNFDGSFSDIVTIAHELGHAYHGQQIFSHRPLNGDYSMPVAETASTFNENLVMRAAIAAAPDRESKLALLESRLQDITQIMCDIYSRYLFETAVFEARPEQFMQAGDLCEKMLAAQKTAYGSGLDQNCLHPYMWVCKSHYYSGGLSFYNFPYAFGGLFAGGLYALYLQEGKPFVKRYQQLLHETTVRSVEDTAKVVGIDLTQRSFWEQGLAAIAEEIDEFLALTQD